MKKVRVLVVGQTPPPYHGQAIMIERLVKAKFDTIEITHLRMSFSETIQQIGKIRWRKIKHFFALLVNGIRLLASGKFEVLYFPPAGPMMVPLLRDMVLLSTWRIFTPKVIYHFRAGGISEYLKGKSSFFRAMARWAYGKPDAAILLSSFNPNDGEFFGAKKQYIVPNGMEDLPSHLQNVERKDASQITVLYLGMLTEEKGIFILLDAFSQVIRLGVKVRLELAGEFDSDATRKAFVEKIGEYDVEQYVQISQSVIGEKKWQFFARGDILCFLSHYRAEAFGNVVLEAMMCGLPVIATKWRGIQDLVTDGYNGYLVPVKDAASVVDKLKLLISDANLRKKLGANGRERFLKHYSLDKHLKEMERVILETACGAGSPESNPSP